MTVTGRCMKETVTMRVLAANRRLRRDQNGRYCVRIVLAIALVGLVWRFSALPLFESSRDGLPPTSRDDVKQVTANVFSNNEKKATSESNETAILLDDIMSSLDRIIAKQTETREMPQSEASPAPQPSSCAPREGLIISNTMGRLANNLFEVGFANRVATDLCWKVLFRPFWQGEIPNPRATECFPHAMLPTDHHASLTGIPLEVQDKLKLNSSFWEAVSTKQGNRLFRSWFAEREQEGIAHKVANDGSLFTGDAPHRLVQQIRNETSQTSLISLEAFFIHGDWMNEWADKIREWFAMNDSCCHHTPPEDAVVIHVRDFKPKDHTNMGIKPPVYTHIMRQYNLTDRPIWIVCQPQTVESAFFKELVASFGPKNVTIVPGQDQYDAFCTLTRAKTLLLTSASSFSQMAAFLADSNATVHYPFKTLRMPKVTLSVPGWKYHLVDHQSLDKVVQFDVGRDKIRFKAA